jgi:hypothetical protein
VRLAIQGAYIPHRRAAGADAIRRTSRQCLDGRRVANVRSAHQLFLFVGSQGRLPRCGLLAWRRGTCLDLLLFRLLGLPIPFLLPVSHVDLLGFEGDTTNEKERDDNGGTIESVKRNWAKACSSRCGRSVGFPHSPSDVATTVTCNLTLRFWE